MSSFLRPQGHPDVVVTKVRSLNRRIAYCMNLIEDVHELSERDTKSLVNATVYDIELLLNKLKECVLCFTLGGIFLKPFPNDKMVPLSKKHNSGTL
jgi:hypothetical protein